MLPEEVTSEWFMPSGVVTLLVKCPLVMTYEKCLVPFLS